MKKNTERRFFITSFGARIEVAARDKDMLPKKGDTILLNKKPTKTQGGASICIACLQPNHIHSPSFDSEPVIGVGEFDDMADEATIDR
jgi:CDP-diacylglycerol pyrophosphatase